MKPTHYRIVSEYGIPRKVPETWLPIEKCTYNTDFTYQFKTLEEYTVSIYGPNGNCVQTVHLRPGAEFNEGELLISMGCDYNK